jgi:peptide/nickel transport system substrate-binding protein
MRCGLFAEPRFTRRRLLAFAAACGAGVGWSRSALASSRLPAGGKLSFRIPWPLATLDPHRIDDASAAIVGPALFDSLYTFDDAGAAVPSLAEGPPEASGSRLLVTLRSGLSSALGKPIRAKEAALALARAGSLGARAWLVEVGAPKVESPGVLSFAFRDASKLSRLLASPLTAIVPPSFTAERPDGTGPFRATRKEDALVLDKNERAASGPAFLDQVTIHEAPDLAASLSAFESGADDMGWLGSGLHEPRPNSKSFDAGSCAWAILRTGSAAGVAWDGPGVAQSLCDGIPTGRLSYLAVGPAWPNTVDEGWGGTPCDLLVRDDAPWLHELARVVASSITRPSHEVTARLVPVAEFMARRSSRAFSLAVDVARPLGPGMLGSLIGLATADDPLRGADLMRHPPRTDAVPRILCRTTRVGVLGDIRIQGGRAPDVGMVLGPGRLDLGSFTRVHGQMR